MQKKCKSCGKILNVSDDKLPLGRAVVATCPFCREKVRLLRDGEEFPDDNIEIKEAQDISKNVIDSIPLDDGNPFDFIEEDGESVMVCIENQEMRNQVAGVLDYLEYNVFKPETNQDALRDLRLKGEFSIIAVDEKFACDHIKNNAVLNFVKRLVMRERRDIFVILISDTRKSMDRKDAFVHSVNMIINKSHISGFEEFLKKGLGINEGFYKNFRESMKKRLSI